MPAMMMRTSGLVFVCSMIVAGCASSDDGSGNPPDAATVSGPVCGDAVCSAAEVGHCQADCGDGGGGGGGVQPMCGNNTCETGETTTTCPNDCHSGGGGGGGACPTDPTACLGCLLDASLCPAGLDVNACTNCILGGAGGGGGGGLPGCNLNGVCDAGEDAMTCPTDCP
jgi:hypothetical protein